MPDPITDKAVTAHWTSHGWWIGDGPEPVEGRPSRRARCGGPGGCSTCKSEAVRADQPATTPTGDLRKRARMAIEDALGVELVPLLNAETITVTASMTEDAADAVLRLARQSADQPATTGVDARKALVEAVHQALQPDARKAAVANLWGDTDGVNLALNEVHESAILDSVVNRVLPLLARQSADRDTGGELEEAHDLNRSYAREIADIAKALGFSGDNAEPDPVDILARINRLVADRDTGTAALRAENEALKAKLNEAYQHIGEQALIDMDEPIPPYGSPERDARVQALRGEQGE